MIRHARYHLFRPCPRLRRSRGHPAGGRFGRHCGLQGRQGVKKAGKAPGAAGKRSVKPTAAAAAKQAPAAREAKPKKPKLVRDSFTIPKEEYAAIEGLKQRLALQGAPAKKSELLRAGLVLLASLPDAALAKAMQAIPSIKTGRPKSEPAGTAIGAKPAKAPKARADGKA